MIKVPGWAYIIRDVTTILIASDKTDNTNPRLTNASANGMITIGANQWNCMSFARYHETALYKNSSRSRFF